MRRGEGISGVKGWELQGFGLGSMRDEMEEEKVERKGFGNEDTLSSTWTT